MQSPTPIQHRLGIVEKVGYGLGDTSINFFFQFVNIFLLKYYTDVFGLEDTTAGTMFLVATLWDAVNDPLMGAIADRTKTKWGKYRPYLVWFAIPYAISGYLLVANPDLGPAGKVVFAYVTFLAFKTFVTTISVPYGALMGVMSDDQRERVALSTFRFLGAFGGGFLIALMVEPLVGALGGESKVLGFQRTMLLFGAVSVLLLLVTFRATRERLEPRPDTVNLATDVGLLFKNRPWVVMGVAAICTLAAIAIRNGVTLYYFDYVVGDNAQPLFTIGWESTVWLLKFNRSTIFLSSGMLAFIAGVALSGVVAGVLGKRNGLILMTLLNAVTVLAFFFIPPDAYTVMVVVNLLGNFFAGPTPALVWALYTDVADYGEFKFGRRATGLVMSAAMFAQKLGLSIGGAIPGWMLGLFGFEPNQVQTPDAVFGLRLLFSIIPGIFALLNGLVLLLYPLSRADTQAMERELAQRRQQ